MDPDTDADQRDLLEHVMLPVANKDDALGTAEALEPYGPDHVTVLHVVEQSEQVADESFTAVQTVFPEADKHTAYGRDTVEKIFEATTEVGATAIAYRSRGGGRLMHFLSGDLSLKLVTQAETPVIALPRTDTET